MERYRQVLQEIERAPVTAKEHLKTSLFEQSHHWQELEEEERAYTHLLTHYFRTEFSQLQQQLGTLTLSRHDLVDLGSARETEESDEVARLREADFLSYQDEIQLQQDFVLVT